jgi:hypothetical protein
MNGQINQLYQQALEFAYKNVNKEIWNTDNFHAIVAGKFAELILIEVTDILSTYRGKMVFEDGAEYNYEHPIIAIRKHFGVKDWT